MKLVPLLLAEWMSMFPSTTETVKSFLVRIRFLKSNKETIKLRLGQHNLLPKMSQQQEEAQVNRSNIYLFIYFNRFIWAVTPYYTIYYLSVQENIFNSVYLFLVLLMHFLIKNMITIKIQCVMEGLPDFIKLFLLIHRVFYQLFIVIFCSRRRSRLRRGWRKSRRTSLSGTARL